MSRARDRFEQLRDLGRLQDLSCLQAEQRRNTAARQFDSAQMQKHDACAVLERDSDKWTALWAQRNPNPMWISAQAETMQTSAGKANLAASQCNAAEAQLGMATGHYRQQAACGEDLAARLGRQHRRCLNAEDLRRIDELSACRSRGGTYDS